MENTKFHMLRKLKSRILKRLKESDGYSAEIERYHKFFKPLGANSSNEWIRKSTEIFGWLFPGEHELLWSLGVDSPQGQILEVGTWMGKSACILAGSCKHRGDGSKVFCVDPFDQRGTDWQREFHKRLTGATASTFDQFIANACRLGFYDEVIPIAKPSEDVLGLIAQPLRLVFLDGWHDYDHVKLEFSLVSPQIVKGGFLALHDSTDDFPGVRRFAGELTSSKEFEPIPGAGSISVFRKR